MWLSFWLHCSWASRVELRLRILCFLWCSFPLMLSGIFFPVTVFLYQAFFLSQSVYFEFSSLLIAASFSSFLTLLAVCRNSQ